MRINEKKIRRAAALLTVIALMGATAGCSSAAEHGSAPDTSVQNADVTAGDSLPDGAQAGDKVNASVSQPDGAAAAEGQEDSSISSGFGIHTGAQAKYLAGNYKLYKSYASGEEELSRPEPVVIAEPELMSDGAQIKAYAPSCVLYISEYEDMRESRKYLPVDHEFRIYNLKVGTEYWYGFDLGEGVKETYSFVTDPQAPRNLYVDGVTNVRDIGGWKLPDGSTVRQGVIFRSARFNENESTELLIGGSGITTMVEELGIRTELDIRSTDDNENGGITDSPLGETIRYISIPFNSGGNIILLNKERLPEIFEVFGNKDNYPIVFHCSIGTDRTGMIAFLINGLMGVGKEDLYRDFLFSNFGMIGKMRAPSIIETYMQTVDTAAGSSLSEKIYNYLVGAGVDPGDIETLKEMLTESGE